MPIAENMQSTLYVFVDCLSPHTSELVEDLFNRYGNSVKYFGGGGGNATVSEAPCIFHTEGAFRNAAVCALTSLGGDVRLRHGWQRVEGPFVATKTDANTIMELNWEPAGDVYLRSLPEGLQGVSPEDFFAKVTPGYPFAIQKEGEEDLVRGPVKLTGQSELVCVSGVPDH